jgi:hypothetical protein
MKSEDILALALPFQRGLVRAILGYVDANAPKSGKNTSVTDAQGGGKVVDSLGNRQADSQYPLQILDASSGDFPGRVRILNGTLGSLLPAEMNVPDGVLSDGTDNSCYITCGGGGYVYGKVLVDSDTGIYTESHVYYSEDTEDPDDTFCYLIIGYVTVDENGVTPANYVQGSQSLTCYASGDGTILQPNWSS